MKNQIIDWLLKKHQSTNRSKKKNFLRGMDSFLLLSTLYVSFIGKFGFSKFPAIWDPSFVSNAVLVLSLFWILSSVSSFYKMVLSLSERSILSRGLSFSIILFGSVFLINQLLPLAGLNWKISHSILFQTFFLFSFLHFFSRLSIKWSLQWLTSQRKSLYRTIIWGAGEKGIQLAYSMQRMGEHKPMLFVDEQEELQQHCILGLEVISPDLLSQYIEKYACTHLVITDNSFDEKRKVEFLQLVQDYSIRLLEVRDSLQEFGKESEITLQEFDLTDLLGRKPIEPQIDLIQKKIKGRIVLVTGAGGSIGSELCRQIISQEPRLLLGLEVSELALYQITQEIKALNAKQGREYSLFVPVLGDIRNASFVNELLRNYSVETIYHTAAYKHVPIVENNIVEGIKNNIFGTENLVRAAIQQRVKTFLFVSTDKAVRPTNVMGATKRVGELVVQAYSSISKNTDFSIVRFGNVLGSSGSVIPHFKKQIEQGGPVTVTHPDVTRFFMTIPEAVELVLQASGLGKSGEVFLLDMGESVRIQDLAVKMIHLYGLKPRFEGGEGDIPIVFTGLREGEKLYEELLINCESYASVHPKIKVALEESLAWDVLQEHLQTLQIQLSSSSSNELKLLLKRIVREYTPQLNEEEMVPQEEKSYPVLSAVQFDSSVFA